MMKNMKRWAMLFVITGPTPFGMNCTTQVRDAAAAGVLDFITGATTDTLSGAAFPEPDPEPFQVDIIDD